MKYSAALKSSAKLLGKSIIDMTMYEGIWTGFLWVLILGLRVATLVFFPITWPILAYAHKRDIELAPSREKRQRERMQAKVEELRTKLQRQVNG